MRILYRVRQFWHTISAKPDPVEHERVLALINPEQAALFSQLQTGEKNHAMAMVRKLIEQGDDHPDLLAAALLHDVGKLCYRLNPLERSVIVLVGAVMPELAHRWGHLPPNGWVSMPGWRKPFVVAEQHAHWGAEMARDAGVSALTATLISAHPQPHVNELGELENNLLHKLWVVDNES